MKIFNIAYIEINEKNGQEYITYQASSPDEIALVKFSEEIGLTLHDRTFTNIKLKTLSGMDIYLLILLYILLYILLLYYLYYFILLYYY